MEQFSPFTRRLVAVGILSVVIISALNMAVLPFFSALATELDALAASRVRRAKLEHFEAMPSPPPAPAPQQVLSFGGRTGREAADRMAVALREAASRASVTIDVSAPAAKGQSLSLQVSASGAETSVLEFINQVERGEPVVRFAAWEIVAGPDAQTLRFQGQTLATWTVRP